MRERERLLEQQAGAATPQADEQTPDFPVSPPPQSAPSFPPAPQPAVVPAEEAASEPTSAFAPRAANSGAPEGSPFGGPVAAPVADEPAPVRAATPSAPAAPQPAPADPSPFAPRATPQPWSRQDSASDDDGPTPERTLTRRELRALIEASQSGEDLDDTDDTDGIDDPVTPAAPAGQPAPSRTTTPHQPAANVEADGQPAVAKPVGHWTSQLDLPDEQPEPFDQLLARAGGGSHGVPTTTNALILPTMPNQGAIAQPLPDGGEIIVTGSIDLPRSFGATGLHPGQLDSSDVDRLIDHVEDAGGGGAAPVSASRAISTQGHPRDMIAPPKKEGVNAPLVLAVTAGVLALGVVASLVVGAMVGLF
jgi:hypothetical protein